MDLGEMCDGRGEGLEGKTVLEREALYRMEPNMEWKVGKGRCLDFDLGLGFRGMSDRLMDK